VMITRTTVARTRAPLAATSAQVGFTRFWPTCFRRLHSQDGRQKKSLIESGKGENLITNVFLCPSVQPAHAFSIDLGQSNINFCTGTVSIAVSQQILDCCPAVRAEDLDNGGGGTGSIREVCRSNLRGRAAAIDQHVGRASGGVLRGNRGERKRRLPTVSGGA
jgi:hypothetical protein